MNLLWILREAGNTICRIVASLEGRRSTYQEASWRTHYGSTQRTAPPKDLLELGCGLRRHTHE